MRFGVVVPAAGLGTRLAGLADGAGKEMLALGGRPILEGALLEAEAAGADAVAVVTAPGKTDLRRLLEGRDVVIVEQPEPVGTMDAVARGRGALGVDRVAVVYPDMLHLPDQRGLARLVRAADGTGGTWYGLVRRTPERAARMGRSARVETTPLGDGLHRVTAVYATPGPPGALHTVLAELRCAREEELLLARRREGDAGLLPVLARLAAEGLLYGAELHDVLDAGIPAGYLDAKARFDEGRARWRTPETAS